MADSSSLDHEELRAECQVSYSCGFHISRFVPQSLIALSFRFIAFCVQTYRGWRLLEIVASMYFRIWFLVDKIALDTAGCRRIWIFTVLDMYKIIKTTTVE